MTNPTLRFNSELCNAFPDWGVIKIKDLSEKMIGGGTPDKNNLEFWTGSVPWISSSDLSLDNINAVKITRFISDSALKNSATKLIHKGSILIVSRVGVGKVAVAPCDLCTSQDFANLINIKYDSFFLAYALIKHMGKKLNEVQGTSIKGITSREIKESSISIPCLEEQQKIASFFSTLDQKIELNERKLEALEKLKKGVTQKILNKKIRFQKDDGTDFPDTVSCSLRYISAYSKCNVEKKNSLFIGNEQLISNFGGATLNFREVAKGNEFNSGDILFGNIRPYLKKVWLSNESGVASPDVLIFKATNAIPGYLKFILSSERFFNHVAQGYKGSKMPRGDKHQIMDFSIQCPCLEEQQKIADFLSALDSKIDIKRKTVATMRDLKRGLMQQMFV